MGGEGTCYKKDGTWAGFILSTPQLSESLQDQSLGVAPVERERGGRRPRKSSILCSFCCLLKRNKSGLGGKDAWVLGGWEGVGNQWRERRCWMHLS